MTNQEPDFEYRAIAIEQQPGAPMMYVLGVAADQLLEWADVPNAKRDYMAGYQRVYSEERAGSITEFLRMSPRNIIPGAVIVTVNSLNSKIKTDTDGITRISISAPEPIALDEKLKEIYETFYKRLSPSEIESIETKSGGNESGEGDDEDENIGIPGSYLASLAAELKDAITDFDSLPKERREAIENYAESVSKPGLIIDGQHRVFGAKDVAQNSVVLPVVLLPGLSFAEQVFHFYVLNNKAKPLTATELRRTVSTSLTNQEIDELWQRFEDAGVDPEATRWTFKLNTELQSPFKGLIDFGLEGSGFIKENVAYQLVSKFVNMPKKYSLLYKGIECFETKDDGRLIYFYAFWNSIRDRYSDAWEKGVQDGGNQLFMKASLLVLQNYLLDQLVQYTVVKQVEGGVSPFNDLDDLAKAVKGLLVFLPADFFSESWQVKQIDTTDGHKFLRAQIELAVSGQGKNFRKQQMFKKTKGL